MFFFQDHEVADQAKRQPGNIEDLFPPVQMEWLLWFDLIQKIILLAMFGVDFFILILQAERDIFLPAEIFPDLLLDGRKKQVMVMIPDDEMQAVFFFLRKLS